MLTAIAAACLWLASPQEPGALSLERLGSSGFRARFEQVDGVTDVSLWLGVEVGTAHDPLGASGFAQLVAEALRGDQPAASEHSPREVIVLPGATLIGVTVPRQDAAAELARFAGWLSGTLQLDEDDLLHARGRALLRADDEAEVLPGPVLRGRALVAMCAGTSDGRLPGGVAREIRQITPGQVRARVRATWRAGRAFLVALGACDDELRDAARAAFGELSTAVEPLPEPIATDPIMPAAESMHDRVAAPFVLVAIPARRCGEPGYVPFLVAIEVARGRAAHAFATPRGGELKAGFPPLQYDPTAMPPLAFVGRRGRDQDSVERVGAEVEALIAGLRSAAAGAGEVRAAILSLSSQFGLPPFREAERDAMRRYPVFLHQRAGILARYVVHGWPEELPTAIGAVTENQVREALSEAFAEGLGRSFALVPVPGVLALPPGAPERR